MFPQFPHQASQATSSATANPYSHSSQAIASNSSNSPSSGPIQVQSLVLGSRLATQIKAQTQTAQTQTQTSQTARQLFGLAFDSLAKRFPLSLSTDDGGPKPIRWSDDKTGISFEGHFDNDSRLVGLTITGKPQGREIRHSWGTVRNVASEVTTLPALPEADKGKRREQVMPPGFAPGSSGQGMAASLRNAYHEQSTKAPKRSLTPPTPPGAKKIQLDVAPSQEAGPSAVAASTTLGIEGPFDINSGMYTKVASAMKKDIDAWAREAFLLSEEMEERISVTDSLLRQITEGKDVEKDDQMWTISSQDKKPVGLLLLRKEGKHCVDGSSYISYLITHPESKGNGKKLLEQAEQASHDHGNGGKLCTIPFDEPAFQFFYHHYFNWKNPDESRILVFDPVLREAEINANESGEESPVSETRSSGQSS